MITRNILDDKKRIIFEAGSWIIIAVYTFLLPSFLLVYRAILNAYGKSIVSKVPLAIVAILGIGYIITMLCTRRNLKGLLYLIPCAIITYFIIRLEENPNKHIHIPEYVLMAWLLYVALTRGYRGKGIFLLIFICATMLGVVDELEQGIHPSRFYGWSDMLVNSSSSLIGILTIMGLMGLPSGSWSWRDYLKEYKVFTWLNLAGAAGVTISCVHLFQVQAGGGFWGTYPAWLWAWNLAFIIIAPSTWIVMHWRKRRLNRQNLRSEFNQSLFNEARTAEFWVFPLLVILMYMHTLVVIVSVSGIEFR